MKIFLQCFLTMLIPFSAYSQYNITTVDFLPSLNLKSNAAGPMLVVSDATANKIYAVNTLSSSISIIDGKTDSVENIPIGIRGFQHLKRECFTINPGNGLLYLIGNKCFAIIDQAKKASEIIKTEKQYECIAVDKSTGNVFLTGRESAKIGFYNSKSKIFEIKDWLVHEEKLENLNQTPPPAIRKVIALNDEKRTIVAIDGFTSGLYLFDAETVKIASSRKLKLGNNDGRWHLAGYDPKTKYLYLATETKKRKITDAAQIDVFGNNDIIVNLPDGFTEPVGISYNTKLHEVYIPYDNNPSVHTINFNNAPNVNEIKIPSYGNDGSALDENNDLLYIASWAHGEIEVIDLKQHKFIRKITDLGIIPHMFTLCFNSKNGSLYFPVGASAVNGNYGAALTKLEPVKQMLTKIRTGWAPIEIIDFPERNSVLVFNNEDRYAEVKKGGENRTYQLPYSFPVCAVHSPEGNIYLSYGPHQSYWPTVYIWGAKNGILTINKNDLSIYDRRIPRQAMQMVTDKKGILYLEQNNWGKEPLIINKIEDEVRNYDIGKRISLEDSVERETTQRVMKYDNKENLIYLLRLAETDEKPSILSIINPDSNKAIKSIEVEKNGVALEFDDNYIYVANYESNSVSMIDKKTYEIMHIKAGKAPLRLCKLKGKVWVLNSGSNDLMEVKMPERNRSDFAFKIPFEATPENMFCWNNKLIITLFNNSEIFIISFDPETKEFVKIFNAKYPYGDVSFDSGNASFYVKAVYGDIIFSLTKGIEDKNGDFYISDFLAGKLYMIQKQN